MVIEVALNTHIRRKTITKSQHVKLAMEKYVAPSPLEVLLTSDKSGQLFNVAAWDPDANLTSVANYKGGSCSAPRTLCLLQDSFLISSQPQKPVLNVWQLNRHEQRPHRLTSPASLVAMTASNSGKYLLGAAEDVLYLWQTNNGSLARVLRDGGHRQRITAVKFVPDDGHFVSAAEDGSVLVWSLLECVVRRAIPGQSREQMDRPLPKHSRHDHRLAVTDVAVSASGDRIATASLDKTSKIYCLFTGKLLLDVSIGVKLHSVAVDSIDTNVFLGGEDGVIYSLDLKNTPRDVQITRDEKSRFRAYAGHKRSVTCLSCSSDGYSLASGSEDATVKLWDIDSGECLRTLEHRAPISNLMFVLPSSCMWKPDEYRPSLILTKSLERSVTDSQSTVEFVLREEIDSEEENKGGKRKRSESGGGDDQDLDKSEEIKRLKQVNLDLYRFATERILNGK